MFIPSILIPCEYLNRNANYINKEYGITQETFKLCNHIGFAYNGVGHIMFMNALDV